MPRNKVQANRILKEIMGTKVKSMQTTMPPPTHPPEHRRIWSEFRCIPVEWSPGSDHFTVSTSHRQIVPTKGQVALIAQRRLVVGRTMGILIARPAHADLRVIGITAEREEVEVVLRVPRRQLNIVTRNTLRITTRLLGSTPVAYRLKYPGKPPLTQQARSSS